MSDDEAPPLRVPKARSSTAQIRAPIRLLSMTGGGYRGLFTAKALVELCRAARHPGALNSSIDVFAGTSIGGLMACALAVGVIPQRVLDAIDAHGPAVFKKKRLATVRRIVFGTLYDKDNLAKAIDHCLGAHAGTPLNALEQGLVVPAVDWVNGRVSLFMSAYFGQAHASSATLKEVCLATAAAPTYFEPAAIDGAPMLDGGLAANNPDMLALNEVMRRFPGALARIEMLSLGTAGFDKPRPPHQARRSGLGWAPDLANFMIDLQERSAAAQAARLLGGRYLRVNHPGTASAAFCELDAANDDSRSALLNAAQVAADTAYAQAGAFIDRMFAAGRKG